MKPLKPVILILISYLFLLGSCTQNKITINSDEQSPQAVLLQKPETYRINHDSELPRETAFTLLNKIIPGESYLPLSLKQKMEGVTPTKSKHPKITIINEKTIQLIL